MQTHTNTPEIVVLKILCKEQSCVVKTYVCFFFLHMVLAWYYSLQENSDVNLSLSFKNVEYATRGWMFHQDKAPKHTIKETINLFQKEKKYNSWKDTVSYWKMYV